ncbi:hypothetical protein [Hyphomicrobium sp.]|uniref:hypothetical protein n=1 Tax=Hyphomicrobium sp. TaxID=82 RepID=UPI000FC34699|nr:hypothetical protein [Hyphomicrobium sp.]RUO97840.1 MAG: hypothetical protein EKK30_13975 [Hyphomicrobium sp.]
MPPPSIYRINPIRDLAFAIEFMKEPVGHHSPGLQRILHVFRGEPLTDKYVLVTVTPHKKWQLARLSGERGKPLRRLDTFYSCLKEAERDVFRRRWKEATGQELVLPQQAEI